MQWKLRTQDQNSGLGYYILISIHCWELMKSVGSHGSTFSWIICVCEWCIYVCESACVCLTCVCLSIHLPFFCRRDKPPMDKSSKTLLVDMLFYMWAGNVTGSYAGLLEATTATV